MKLREAAGDVVLLDARKPSDIMHEITKLGLNIDQGMIVKIQDKIYYGSDAIHVLASLSTRSDFFNRTMFFIFKSKRVSSFFYPTLKFFRNAVLWLLRIPLINNLDQNNEH